MPCDFCSDYVSSEARVTRQVSITLRVSHSILGAAGEPKGELKSAIDQDFGSFEEFKKQFSTAGATQFGSGWAWLVLDGGKLKVRPALMHATPCTAAYHIEARHLSVTAFFLDAVSLDAVSLH